MSYNFNTRGYGNLFSGVNPKWGFNPDDSARRGALGAHYLSGEPFSPWQSDILSQMQQGMGDRTQRYLPQMQDYANQIVNADPFGGYGNQISQQFGNTQDYQGSLLGLSPYYGNYEGLGQTQLAGLSGIADRLESGGGGLTPEEQQQLFDKAYTRAATPIEASLRRGGWDSLGGQNVLANISKGISEDLALNEAQNRRNDILNAANLRSGLAGQYFGQGQYGAGFGAGNIRSAADIAQNLLSTSLGQGQYAGTFGRQGLNTALDSLLSQAGLEMTGQQNDLSQLGNLYSMVRSGQLAPLDYLTALAGKQAISREPATYPTSAKLADYINSAAGLMNLFGG